MDTASARRLSPDSFWSAIVITLICRVRAWRIREADLRRGAGVGRRGTRWWLLRRRLVSVYCQDGQIAPRGSQERTGIGAGPGPKMLSIGAERGMLGNARKLPPVRLEVMLVGLVGLIDPEPGPARLAEAALEGSTAGFMVVCCARLGLPLGLALGLSLSPASRA